MLSRFASWTETRPATAFAGFLALHAFLWTLLPTLFNPNLPLDGIEAMVYGREWQLGHDKLPPLPWWLVELVRLACGCEFGFYALAQGAVAGAFGAVYWLTRALTGSLGALAAVLVLDGIHYFGFSSVKFNHDVLQLPLWALAGAAYWAALRHGRQRHWLVLGAALGLAFWTKYFVVVLALPLVLFTLADPQARPVLRTPGPWLALAAALIVAAPHIAWLVGHDFLPLQYAQARAIAPRGYFDHLLRPIAALGAQLTALIGAMLIALPLLWPRSQSEPMQRADFDVRILALLAFGPVATLLGLSFVTGRGVVASWGFPLWLYLGSFIVFVFRRTIESWRWRRLLLAWAGVALAYVAAFVVNYTLLPSLDHRYRAAFFPGDRLAAEMSARFRLMTGQRLAYVIADMWVGGNVSHYAPERPRVLIDGNPRRAPWIDLGDLRSKGAIVVWVTGLPRQLPPAYRAVADDAELQEPFSLPYRNGVGSVTIGWAVLRPRPTVATAHAGYAPAPDRPESAVTSPSIR